MSRIYYAVNKSNGNEVSLYYNDRTHTPRYELWCNGNGITTQHFDNIADANRAYNLALR